METPTETKPHRLLPWRGRQLAHAGVLTAVIATAIAAWGSHVAGSRRTPEIMLLYVGAEDCAPCRAWQAGDGASFLASKEFPRIRYREVKSAHLVDVLNDDNWPEELRAYRSQLKRSDGVPLWLVVSDDEIVARQFGAAAWRDTILPKIRSLLRPALI
jgi:hypothetical protein